MFKKNVYFILVLIVVFVLGVMAGKNWERFSVSGYKQNNKYTYSFEGEGRFVTDAFYLDDGLFFIKVANQTGPNDNLFMEVFYDANGNKVKDDDDQWWGQYINVGYEDAESYEGVIPVKAQKGNYFIFIDGGRWQITVNQPEITGKKAGRFESFAGQGQNVSRMFYLEKGKYTFGAEYKGDDNFIVYLVDDRGNYSSRLVNVIGDYSDKFSVDIVIPGNYLFYVDGMGIWKIDSVQK